MTLTLGALITSARNAHPSFDKSRIPDPVLASMLSSYQNTLIAKAVAREKTFGTQLVTLTIAQDADTPAPTALELTETHGVSLAGIITVVNGTMHMTTGVGHDRPLAYIGVVDRFPCADRPERAVYLVGETLCRTVATAWRHVATIDVWYRGVAPALTTLRSVLIVPEAAEPVLSAYGAYVCATRLGQDAVQYAAAWQAAEADYLSSLRLSRRARTVVRREVDF